MPARRRCPAPTTSPPSPRPQTDHVRFDRNVFEARWERQGETLDFTITADTFMRNMVRILVGTMLEAASGRRTPESFTQLLDGAPRTDAGETAPPHGLYLESVSLPLNHSS